MKQYEVVNPYIIFSIRAKTGCKEYALKQGDIVELPATDIAVRAMLSRKQIKEVVEQTAPAAGGKDK